MNLYKINTTTCTMEKQMGKAHSAGLPYNGQANVDGDSSTALLFWVASFAPLPNKKVLVSDYNCRLRLYDPAINVISAFGGPDGDLGSPAGAYNLQCATAATPENTIGQRPSNATGRMLTGVIRGLAYSSVEDRVFFSWEVDTMRRSEIWSVRTDGACMHRRRACKVT
eukprot:tig00020563_g11231.t1